MGGSFGAALVDRLHPSSRAEEDGLSVPDEGDWPARGCSCPFAGWVRLVGTFGSGSPAAAAPSWMASMEQFSPSTLLMACFRLSVCCPRWNPSALPCDANASVSWLSLNERGFASALTFSQVLRLIRASSSMISGHALRIISICPDAGADPCGWAGWDGTDEADAGAGACGWEGTGPADGG